MAAGAMESSMRQLSEHRARPGTVKVLATAAALLCPTALSQPNLAYAGPHTLHRKKQMTDIAIDTLAPPQTVTMNGKMSARETMSTKNPPPEMVLPNLVYGLVWLISASDGDPRHLSPLALRALGTADAVIHDPGISQAILDFVKPPRYRESAAPRRAIERSIKLAQDDWRVVHFVEGNTMERAVESAFRCAECDIPFRIVPNAGEPLGDQAPLGLFLVRKLIAVGGADPRPMLVLLIATPQSEAATGAERCQPPLGFSMSGLAG
jgi:hypothetical protein